MGRISLLALDTFVGLRQHPLRSFLSILGLVIGVAALVAILALADGMERFARDQIGTTTDLQNITVVPQTQEEIDGVTVRRAHVAVPTLEDAAALSRHLGDAAGVALLQQRPAQVVFDTIRTAAALSAAGADLWSFDLASVAAGRLFTAMDVEERRPVVVVSAVLAERLGGTPASLVGRRITVGEVEAEIVGVLDAPGRIPEVYGPFTAFAAEGDRVPPNLLVRAVRAEEVPLLVPRISAWLNDRYAGGADAFRVATNEMRTRQIRQAMRLFKLVFGLITGISVLVGGVGVMNVLLVTVTERTREIGIRKAVGARRSDIRVQFLAEAMTVSGAGSVAGLVLGLLGVFSLLPLIRHLTEVPFQAAVTVPTLLVVAGVAVAVGVLFGTYPAVRASRLSPVEAMRHE